MSLSIGRAEFHQSSRRHIPKTGKQGMNPPGSVAPKVEPQRTLVPTLYTNEHIARALSMQFHRTDSGAGPASNHIAHLREACFCSPLFVATLGKVRHVSAFPSKQLYNASNSYLLVKHDASMFLFLFLPCIQPWEHRNTLHCGQKHPVVPR